MLFFFVETQRLVVLSPPSVHFLLKKTRNPHIELLASDNIKANQVVQIEFLSSNIGLRELKQNNQSN